MKLIVHIGLPKTGSTNYNYHLRGNNRPPHTALLSKTGRLPLLLAGFDAIRDFYWNDRLQPSQAVFQKAVDEARTAGKSLVILRDGDFSLLTSVEGLRPMLTSFTDIKILFTVRRQDLFIESYYNQLQKHFGVFPDIHTFLEHMEIAGYLDWYHKARLWSDEFGKDNVKVRVFDKPMFSHGVLRSYLEAFELPVPNSVPDVRENISIHRDCVAIAHGLKQAGLYDTHNELIQRAFARYRDSHYSPSKHLLPPTDRRALVNRYAKSNAALATDFVGQQDLFAEFADEPEWSPANSDLTAAVQLLTTVIQECEDDSPAGKRGLKNRLAALVSKSR